MRVVLQVLCLCSASVLSLDIERELWYEHKPRTWEDARRFCRSQYGDLATDKTPTDNFELKSVAMGTFHAWIGLKNFTSGWHWANGFQEKPILDVFATDEPESGHECGKIIYNQGKAYADDCDDKHFFFCESINNTFHFVAETKTWAEAQEHCVQEPKMWFADFPGSTNFKWSSAVTELRHFPVWVGLHHDGAVWRWSNGTVSKHWDSVLGTTPGFCMSVTSSYKTPHIYNCSQAYPFACQRQSLVLVPEQLSWEEGLEVCMNISPLNDRHLSLASLEESNLQTVLNYTTAATTDKVWLGLRFLAGIWFWSDGASFSLPSLPSCPEEGCHCGALVLSTGSIEATNCYEKLNLLCYGR